MDSNILEYKGYLARIEINPEEELLHGRILNIKDVVNFYGKTIPELRKEFASSVEEYLEMCKQINQEPDKPYSGKFNVRVAPELHKALACKAAKQGKSLNAYVNDALSGVAQCC